MPQACKQWFHLFKGWLTEDQTIVLQGDELDEYYAPADDQ